MIKTIKRYPMRINPLTLNNTHHLIFLFVFNQLAKERRGFPGKGPGMLYIILGDAPYYHVTNYISSRFPEKVWSIDRAHQPSQSGNVRYIKADANRCPYRLPPEVKRVVLLAVRSDCNLNKIISQIRRSNVQLWAINVTCSQGGCSHYNEQIISKPTADLFLNYYLNRIQIV